MYNKQGYSEAGVGMGAGWRRVCGTLLRRVLDPTAVGVGALSRRLQPPGGRVGTAGAPANVGRPLGEPRGFSLHGRSVQRCSTPGGEYCLAHRPGLW
jgi:hypothetical protein